MTAGRGAAINRHGDFAAGLVKESAQRDVLAWDLGGFLYFTSSQGYLEVSLHAVVKRFTAAVAGDAEQTGRGRRGGGAGLSRDSIQGPAP